MLSRHVTTRQAVQRSQDEGSNADLIRQAAQWVVDLQSEDATPALRQSCDEWRAAHPDHEKVWQRVQMVAGKLSDVPGDLAHATLVSPTRPARREAIKRLVLLAGGAGVLTMYFEPWRTWGADASTTIGEVRRVLLPDGSRVVLNTDTAVKTRFSTNERRLILLHGEILVETAHFAQREMANDFLVEAPHGLLRALGTRFIVRTHTTATELQLYEGAVEITREAGERQVVQAGASAWFGSDGVARLGIANLASTRWIDGMLAVNNMPLQQFLAELSRYRRGHLSCSDDAASLLVSGTFPLADTTRGLRALQNELPVVINSFTDYWVTVRRRT